MSCSSALVSWGGVSVLIVVAVGCRFVQRSGFNVIHFTPVQELGISGSNYCILDQTLLSKKLFTASTEEGRVKQLTDVIRRAEKKFGILSVTDIVLNHTAPNSPFLLEHPEAGYSLENSPHLIPALVLDDALLDFSGLYCLVSSLLNSPYNSQFGGWQVFAHSKPIEKQCRFGQASCCGGGDRERA